MDRMTEPGWYKVKVLISAEEINRRVQELAEQISSDYDGKTPVVVGILKGSWIFLADLVRYIRIPVFIDFLTVSSYGMSTKSSGVVKIVMDLKCPLEDRDVLLVEDILDSGLTLKYIMKHLEMRKPRSLRLCVLMDKPARRQVEIKPDYLGFTVPDKFVVGYGADFAESYRQLPFIGYIEETDNYDEE
jgi:hypoxanthine phosphoribosyltransferase|uniref:Hypoxanthine phosphoribosyltransferase n=1 Tax=candidate division WOR-3 bacterium TaxID=2052148 RepID=A0A7V3UZP2_UNCW3